jgi:hypothetical protein
MVRRILTLAVLWSALSFAEPATAQGLWLGGIGFGGPGLYGGGFSPYGFGNVGFNGGGVAPVSFGYPAVVRPVYVARPVVYGGMTPVYRARPAVQAPLNRAYRRVWRRGW